MAIRRPSIYSPDWLCQDFLYQEDGDLQERYIQVKWSGEPYERLSETFDYSNPPYSNSEQRGGDIVAQIDYSIEGQVVTITGWDANWRDEWPLRIGVNYLANCLYKPARGYVIRVEKGAYAFWASEFFQPTSNDPFDYLLR